MSIKRRRLFLGIALAVVSVCIIAGIVLTLVLVSALSKDAHKETQTPTITNIPAFTGYHFDKILDFGTASDNIDTACHGEYPWPSATTTHTETDWNDNTNPTTVTSIIRPMIMVDGYSVNFFEGRISVYKNLSEIPDGTEKDEAIARALRIMDGAQGVKVTYKLEILPDGSTTSEFECRPIYQ